MAELVWWSGVRRGMRALGFRPMGGAQPSRSEHRRRMGIGDACSRCWRKPQTGHPLSMPGRWMRRNRPPATSAPGRVMTRSGRLWAGRRGRLHRPLRLHHGGRPAGAVADKAQATLRGRAGRRTDGCAPLLDCTKRQSHPKRPCRGFIAARRASSGPFPALVSSPLIVEGRR